jgi:hypothetical protein
MIQVQQPSTVSRSVTGFRDCFNRNLRTCICPCLYAIFVVFLGITVMGLSIWNLSQDNCTIDVCDNSNDMVACFEISGVVVCDNLTPVTYSSCSEYGQINRDVFRCVSAKTNTSTSLYAPSAGKRYDNIDGERGILLSVLTLFAGFFICMSSVICGPGCNGNFFLQQKILNFKQE